MSSLATRLAVAEASVARLEATDVVAENRVFAAVANHETPEALLEVMADANHSAFRLREAREELEAVQEEVAFEEATDRWLDHDDFPCCGPAGSCTTSPN